jgi:hypothetical protein
VQMGERGDVDQHQLIALNPNDWCIVADRGHRYMRVGCRQESLYCEPAKKEELGAMLVLRARLRLTTLASLRWTWQTLRHLELGHMWTDELERRMSHLKRSESR